MHNNQNLETRNIGSSNISPPQEVKVTHTSNDDNKDSYAYSLNTTPTQFTTDREEELEFYRQAQNKSIYKN